MAAAVASGLLAPDLAFHSRGQAGWSCAGLALAAWLAARHARLGAARALLAGCGFTLGSFLALPLVLPPAPASIARLAERHGGPAIIQGVILTPPSAAPGRVSFVLDARSARSRGVEGPCGGRVSVVVYGLAEDGVPVLTLAKGDEVRLSGELSQPRDFATPGVSSSAAWLARRGIRAALAVKSMTQLELHQSATAGPLAWLRARLVAAIDTHVAGGRHGSATSPGQEIVADHRAAAVLKAMLVADRGGLDGELQRSMAAAGIIHILAISGLHVGILAWFVHLVGGLVGLGERTRFGLALALAWAYVGVAGAPIPAVRAAILLSMVGLGRVIRRDGSALDSLLLALLMAVVLEPGGIADAGFQLTFAAVAGILLFSPRLTPAWRPRWLWLGLAVSAGAELGVLCVSLFHFGRVAPLGIVLNLVAIPLAGLLVVIGMLLPALAVLDSGLADLAGTVVQLTVSVLVDLAGVSDRLGSVRVATPPAWLAVTAALSLAATLLPWPHRGRFLVSLSAAIAVAALFVAPKPSPLAAAMRVHAIDVGQGDAFLIELDEDRALLVDAGGSVRDNNFDVGDRVVVPYLLAIGRRRLEVVAVTHAHPDHSRGVAAVLRELEVGELWLSDDPAGDPIVAELRRIAMARGVRVVSARRGHRVPGIEVLHPPADLPPVTEVANSRSLVLRVGGRGGRVLLTGDIHADAERELTGLGLPLASDVLKVAHHGSRTSSDAAFVASTRARVALVSCGFDNRFRHPAPAVVARLRDAGARLFRTDLDGTITITIDPEGHLSVTTARVRFWRPSESP